jgi:hypothetical protein
MQDNFHRPDDHEAKMARADLFKCAQYSFKLFKMISEDQELEGWVQAKITKAADYIASVYHYMEYEMKISEYGSAVENSDMYSESIRRAFAQKLTEAKVEAKKAKAKMVSKEKGLEEAFDDKAKVGDKKKTATGELTKTDTGVVHRNTSYADDGEADDKSGKGKKSHAKSQSAAEKKSQAPKLKQSPKSAKTWGMKDSEKFDNRDKSVAEGKKPDFLDMDKDGNKKEPMKKAVADKKAGVLDELSPQLMKRAVTKADTMMNKNYHDDNHNATYDYANQGSRIQHGIDKRAGKPTEYKKADAYIKSEPGANTAKGHRMPVGMEEGDVGKCNHTPKGEKCPVHGLKECGGMYEAAPRGQKSQDSAMKVHQIGKSKSPGANLKQGAEDALEKGNHKKIDQIHQYATTTTPTGRAKKVSEGDKFDPLKHVKNPTQGEKTAAKDVKRGSYADRAAMLKSAEADGRLKK